MNTSVLAACLVLCVCVASTQGVSTDASTSVSVSGGSSPTKPTDKTISTTGDSSTIETPSVTTNGTDPNGNSASPTLPVPSLFTMISSVCAMIYGINMQF